MIQIESSNDDVYTAKLECNELDIANLQLKQIIIHVPATFLHNPIENSHAYMKNMAIMNLGLQPSKLKTPDGKILMYFINHIMNIFHYKFH